MSVPFCLIHQIQPRRYFSVKGGTYSVGEKPLVKWYSFLLAVDQFFGVLHLSTDKRAKGIIESDQLKD
jgi:hypothetical protein